MTPPDAEICTDLDGIRRCFHEAAGADRVAVDVETTCLSPFTAASALFSVGFATPGAGLHVLPLHRRWPPNIEASIKLTFADWLTTPGQIRIMHNCKFDLLWLCVYCGVAPRDLKGDYADTLLMSWVRTSAPGKNGLKKAAMRELNAADWSIDVTDVLAHKPETVHRYNALDCFYTLELHDKLLPLLDDMQYRLYSDLLMPAMLAFLAIEHDGVPVDTALLDELETQADEEMQELARRVVANVGKLIDLDSPSQVAGYFEGRGYDLEHRTPSGAVSVNVDALNDLAARYDDPVARDLLRYRTVSKLKRTYLTGLRPHVGADGTLHGSYNLTATVTGRTSSSDPNMQNFPKRRNRHVRSILRAPQDCVMASFDFGQIEARLFGVLTADAGFIQALHDDCDVHLENAEALFGADDAPRYRGAVKSATFAMLYGGGDESVMRAVNKLDGGIDVGPQEVANLRALFFGRFPRFRSFMRETQRFADANGYVESLFGRRRKMPMNYTELVNFPCQSSASDMTLVCMSALSRDHRIAFMIHDDLTFILPDDASLEATLELIALVMLSLPWTFMHGSRLCRAWVPMQVECAVGENWGELEERFKLNSRDCGMSDMSSTLRTAREVGCLLS